MVDPSAITGVVSWILRLRETKVIKKRLDKLEDEMTKSQFEKFLERFQNNVLIRGMVEMRAGGPEYMVSEPPTREEIDYIAFVEWEEDSSNMNEWELFTFWQNKAVDFEKKQREEDERWEME